MTDPFVYPSAVHARRHGPRGYADHASYRPWLRDEFAFRCVYCLRREVWGVATGEYDIDHFQAVSVRPDLALEYDNLLYACSPCNASKSDHAVPDPLATLLGGSVRVLPSGELEADTPDARSLIRQLDLNGSAFVGFRRMWIEIVQLAAEFNPELYRRLMGFPADLPDLSGLRPIGGNARPDGVVESHHARKRRGQLPDAY